MHVIELTGNIIYRTRNYRKAERLFLRMVAQRKPVALVTIGSVKPRAARVNEDQAHNQHDFEECGCCGLLHPAGYAGDCRNDAMRFTWGDLPEDARVLELEDQKLAQGGAICSSK